MVAGRDTGVTTASVVGRWASALADDRLDDVVATYAPGAALRAGGDVVIGADEVRRFWAASPLLGGRPAAAVQVDGPDAVVRWPTSVPSDSDVESVLRVAGGRVVDQSVDDVWRLGADSGAGDAPLVVRTAGDVSDADRAHAVRVVREAVRAIGDRVLHATLRIDVAADPARRRPISARLHLDLDGRPVHARVEAHTVAEAIDLLGRRMRDRVDHVAQARRALRRRGPGHEPGEWRHGDAGTLRSPTFDRPPDERQVVRHRSCATSESTVDEAVFDLESLDHDFHLFRELGSGRDAIVWRAAGGEYGLRRVDGAGERPVPCVAAVTVDAHAAPVLTEDEARERLDAGHEPWVFHADAASGRGHVLYRRRDGHYGVVVPVDELVGQTG